MKKIILVSFFFILSVVSQTIFSETLRISPEQLKQQLSNKQLIILDARSLKDYQAGHIPGAYSFPVNLTYKDQDVNGKISPPVTTQKNFRSRGIDKDSRVIVYDNGDLVDAARLFWILEVYGLTQVKVLDHGYDDWLNKAYPVSVKEPKAIPSQYIATLNHKRIASKFTTQLATRNSNQVVIDARNTSDYAGKTSSAKRFGHIPTAINIPSTHNISENNDFANLKSIAQLTKIYSSIPRDKKVVIYCAIGRVSSSNYLALRELGYDVSNYDASWNEWANDFKLPVDKQP